VNGMSDVREVAELARGNLNVVMGELRERLADFGLPVEVAMIAVQVSAERIGPVVVCVSHPLGELEAVADIAERASEIFREAQ
jgi:hypothetical protein